MGALLPTTLAGRREQLVFLRILAGLPDELVPVKYGLHEPFRTPFTPDALDQIATEWDWSFHWKGRFPRSGGSGWRGSPEHATGVFYVDTRRFHSDHFLDLLSRFDSAFEVDFAYVHLPVPAQLVDSRQFHTHEYPFATVMSTRDLRAGIPGPPWMMILGRPYEELMGDRLTRNAERLAPDSHLWVVRTLPELPEFPRDFEPFQEARRQVRSRLGEQYFVGWEEGKPVVPRFEILPSN